MVISADKITPDLLRKEAESWRGTTADDNFDADSLADILEAAANRIEELQKAGLTLLPHLPKDDASMYGKAGHLTASMDLRRLLTKISN